MSGPFGSQQWMYSSGGFYDHPINQSLRFNDDDSAYLSRTPASAGNRKTWTWSGWVKRGNLGSNQNIFASNGTSNTTYLDIRFNLSNQLQVGNYTALILVTTQVFRDPSAWYHVVWLLDTTQATASNRSRLFVNGVEITSFSTDTRSSYFAQNTDYGINNSALHEIARNPIDSTKYFDGYMAEVNFVDGQALDASSFGETKSGVWIPKEYTGSYGTNGFYLKFANSGSLGADSSGNSNNWTPTNLAATDQVLDSPTNNFATINPLEKTTTSTPTEGNLKYAPSGTAPQVAISTIAVPSTGKWYAEFLRNSATSGLSFGTIGSGRTASYAGHVNSVGYFDSGQIYQNGSSIQSSLTAIQNSDICSIAIDADAQTIQFYVNGTSSGSAVSYTDSQIWFAFGNYISGQIYIANFGQDSSFAGAKTAQGNTDANGIGDFYYAPPSGYLALCTANLPDPVAAIDPAQDANPQDHFNTVLWTGNGTSGRTVTGVGFQPDIIYYKSRSLGQPPQISDAVRGVYRMLRTNATDAEYNITGGGMLQSFDADGFTVGTDASINQSSQTYVAWNWKAGGTGVSNTDGAITSTVSANVDAGFSIVSYTVTTANATVGHGLNQKPDLIIAKQRSTADLWFVVTDVIDGSVDYLSLNSTAAKTDYGTGALTSTTFTNPYAIASSTVIAYCFHSVDGFSKIGSYTGNGSTDGPFVYTGFRPAFVMIKRSDAADNWVLLDSGRNPYNVVNARLFADLAQADGTTDSCDFTSNGFKVKTTASWINASSGTLIFMAFAEMPFKYANAR